jgi:hypothetical protein
MNLESIRNRVNNIRKIRDNPNQIDTVYCPIIEPGTMRVITVRKHVIGTPGEVWISAEEYRAELRERETTKCLNTK